METEQRSKLKALYPHLEMPPIEVLNIPDDYEFMNDDLVEILTIGINGALKANYNI
jgi:protein-tyrosine phosphatase